MRRDDPATRRLDSNIAPRPALIANHHEINVRRVDTHTLIPGIPPLWLAQNVASQSHPLPLSQMQLPLPYLQHLDEARK